MIYLLLLCIRICLLPGVIVVQHIPLSAIGLLSGKSGCGRPVSICTDEYVDVKRQLITDDPHTTLTEHLKFRNVCSVWVPIDLTKDQKQRRVQCATNLITLNSGRTKILTLHYGRREYCLL